MRDARLPDLLMKCEGLGIFLRPFLFVVSRAFVNAAISPLRRKERGFGRDDKLVEGRKDDGDGIASQGGAEGDGLRVRFGEGLICPVPAAVEENEDVWARLGCELRVCNDGKSGEGAHVHCGE